MRSRVVRSVAFLLLLLSSVFVIFADAREDEQPDDYEETARVARVSFVKGEVTLRRAGGEEAEDAQANFPLVEGDTLSTGRDARVEIQIDARNFLRVGGDSVLRVVTLREEGVAVSLVEGAATLRLARFDKDREYFEIDAPGTTVSAEQRGLYRVDANTRGSVRVVTRDGARARIYSETSGFTLRENRSASLVFEGEQAGDWELAAAPSFDEWDAWTNERERYLASHLRHDDRERYYDREVWGAEELDSYGEWTHTSTYGWVWRPHAAAVNSYADWAPYRYGRWTYCPPYGWTWVGDEPWGWAPYHYGRWVYHDNRWGWAPRGYGYKYRRSWWRPALVAFVYLPSSRGEQVCWYPLTYGQRDPHSGFWRRNFRRLNERRRHDLDNLHRRNPGFLRGVSSLPTHDFGRRGRRARRADDELSRQVLLSDPVTGRLQVAPGTERGGASDREGRRARDFRERRTGAGARTPGVALEHELRRSRVFRNREPRNNPDRRGPARGAANVTRTHDTDADYGRHTGAVARPPRPPRDNNNNGDASSGSRPPRPVRTAPSDSNDDSGEGPRRGGGVRRPANTDDSDRAPDVRRPRAPDLRTGGDDGDAPTRRPRPPRSDERPPESSPPPARERREPRFERPPRQERPEPRQERPEPRRERPAPREERPAPRREQPQRSEPAPRERAPERQPRPPSRDANVTRDNDN